MGQTDLFGTEKISKILLKLAPPVMLAQLIQALYNIIDSLFVGRYSDSGLTALSIIYPLQLLMIALAVGTGVGINTVMAAKLGVGNEKEADEYAGVGTPLAGFMWLLFAVICWFAMPFYAKMSTNSEVIIHDVIVYGRIVCVFSFGLFLESIWTKVLQSCGDMKTPMTAQIIGAITNIVLDPLLIFGMFGFPKMDSIRTDYGCTDCHEKRLSQIPAQTGLPTPHCQNLPAGYSEYSYAVGVYLLHTGIESNSCNLFRPGSNRTGTLL